MKELVEGKWYADITGGEINPVFLRYSHTDENGVHFDALVGDNIYFKHKGFYSFSKPIGEEVTEEQIKEYKLW